MVSDVDEWQSQSRFMNPSAASGRREGTAGGLDFAGGQNVENLSGALDSSI